MGNVCPVSSGNIYRGMCGCLTKRGPMLLKKLESKEMVN